MSGAIDRELHATADIVIIYILRERIHATPDNGRQHIGEMSTFPSKLTTTSPDRGSK